MKKLLLISIMLLIFSSLAMAATVTRDMPNRIQPNEQLTVILRITDINKKSEIAVDDVLPLPLKDWSIEGTDEDEIIYRFQDNRASWVFVPNSNQATITYTIDIPNVERSYTFGPLIWIDEDKGIGQIQATNLNVATTKTTMPEEETEHNNYLWLVILISSIILVLALYLIFSKKKD